MVVTEYAIADLRGKTDAGVIEALLNISGSRFQSWLIEQAQRAGKLPKDFRLDARFADNRPERLQAVQAWHPAMFESLPLGSVVRIESAEEPGEIRPCLELAAALIRAPAPLGATAGASRES